jgi:hypothetical protein
VGLQLEDAYSKTHKGVIERMLSNNQDVLANEYYYGNPKKGIPGVKDQVSGSDVADVEKALKAGSVLGESQRQATSIMQAHGTDEKSALERARSISDPKIQEETVKEVKMRFAEQEASKRQADEYNFRAAAEQSKNTRSLPDPVLWNKLSLKDQNELQNQIENLRKGIDPPANSEEYYDLRTLASNPGTRDQFMKTNLLSYGSKVSRSNLATLIDLQADMRSGKDRADKILDGFRSDNSIVNDTLNAAGIDPTPKTGTDQAKKVALFRSKVDEEVRKIQADTGKKATNEQIQSIADNLIVKGKVPGSGWIFDTKKSAFELAPGEKLEVNPKDIPRDDRKKIEAALKKYNRPVNDETVMEIYKKKLGKLTGNGN